MTYPSILNPLPTFTDAKGLPITGGSIYIGVVGLDPETNPQAVYWDSAGATPASQPLNVKGGFVVNGTTPAQIFTASPLSIRVYDAFGSVVYYKASVSQIDAAALAGATGAASIGAATGGTVEDAIWHKGRTTAIAGSKAKLDWVRDDASYPLEDLGALWPTAAVHINHGAAKTFDGTTGGIGAPSAAFVAYANNNGSGGDVCGAILASRARSNNRTVFGANVLALGSGGSGVKYVGLEIDIEPASGDTAIDAGSGGLFINAFNKAIPGPVLMSGGISSGTFNNGIVLGGLATTAAGIALQAAGSADSLVNTTVGTFSTAAIILGNTKARGIRLSGTGTVHGFIYNDGSNNVRHVLGAGGWVLRNNADLASLVSFSDNGTGGTINAENTGGQYQVNGTKVVGVRQTGTATNATDLATVITLANDLKTKLVAHGLIS